MNTEKKMNLSNFTEAFFQQILHKSKKSNQTESFKNLCSSVFICGLFFLLCLNISGQTKIKISPETKVKNEILTLGEVAEISGENAEKFGQISLGYAPNIGMTREISKKKIALSIAAAGFSANEFSLNSPPTVRISRLGQEVEKDLIRKTVENAVFEKFSESGIEVKTLNLEFSGKIDVPVGKVEIRTNFSNVVNPFSKFALPLEIRVDDKISNRFSVNVELEAFAEILVANNDLPVNTRLQKSDFRLEKRRLEKSLKSYLRDFGKLKGFNLIKNLPKDAELTSDSFVASIVIKSGDLVKIVGQSGKMQIIVSGEARTSGKIGDRIAVKNSQSNAVIQATIVDEGVVKVFF